MTYNNQMHQKQEPESSIELSPSQLEMAEEALRTVDEKGTRTWEEVRESSRARVNTLMKTSPKESA